MNSTFTSASRLRRRLGTALASLMLGVLAGCGGGVYIDVPIYNGPPPEVALAVAPTAGSRGEAVQLAAAVTASNGVQYVSFYRIDFGFSTLLGRLSDRPFQWGTSIPIDAGSSVTYFVQACDLAGLCTSSQPVTIGVFR